MIRALATLMVAGLATPSLADEAACKDNWASLATLVASSGIDMPLPGAIRSEDGWCIAETLSLPANPSSHLSLSAERILWRGEGLENFAENGALPSALEARMENFRAIPAVGVPVMDYVFKAQQTRGGIDAWFTYSGDGNKLTLERFEIRLPGGDGLKLSAMAEGVDLTSAQTILQSTATAALHQLTVEIRAETGALFENMLLMPIANALLNDASPPEKQVETLKAQAREIIDALPEEAFPPDTRFAFTELIDDMPNPNGTFSLTIDFDPGFGMQQADKLRQIIARTGVPAVWREATVTASYDRKEIPH